MNKEEKPKSIGLWVAAILILLGLTQPWKWNWNSSESTDNSKGMQHTSTFEGAQPGVPYASADHIVVRDGDHFLLKVNSKEYSPYIDGTEAFVNVRMSADRIYKYPNGETDTLRNGDKPILLKSNIFKIKTLGKSDVAAIRGSDKPINKSLFN